ncbi:hypothetical protein ACJIZ3_011425 [Penstemon smallii]|uniref:Ribosomal protein S18 n=1 Tax=Penstemon smallii TaxID=265156 RepID=A0ABD3UNC8_9LAMI
MRPFYQSPLKEQKYIEKVKRSKITRNEQEPIYEHNKKKITKLFRKSFRS